MCYDLIIPGNGCCVSSRTLSVGLPARSRYDLMIFPSDALTIHAEQNGSGTLVLLSGTNVKYILGIQMQQSGTASDSLLQCGSSIISRNYAKNLTFELANYRCADVVQIVKTGNDSISIELTYVNRDLANTYDPQVASVSARIVTNPVITQYSASQSAAIHDAVYIGWISSIMVVLSLGIITFLTYMKRR